MNLNLDPKLIPPPPVVRERLAQHPREGRLLRSLYNLSLRAAEGRHRQTALETGGAAPAGTRSMTPASAELA